MSVKLLTEHHLEFLSLKGGYTGLSEYTHVKIPHCWESRGIAHYIFLAFFSYVLNYKLRYFEMPNRRGSMVNSCNCAFYHTRIYTGDKAYKDDFLWHFTQSSDCVHLYIQTV